MSSTASPEFEHVRQLENGKWIWLDETGGESGYYETEEDARTDWKRYCKEVLGE